MSTSAAPLAAVRAALEGLVDYAGLFPPAQLDMAAAAVQYARARSGSFAWMLGKFIVPLSRAEELCAALPANEAPFALSVILDGDWDPRDVALLRTNRDRIDVQALEIPVSPDRIGAVSAALSAAGLSELPAYVEWPRAQDWDTALPFALEAVKNAGLDAKIRCGGVVQSAFPSAEQIALFIGAASRRGVAFKATAGLHHPFRHFNAASGLEMHGFLNLLFAATFAFAGADARTLTECIADPDAQNFAFSSLGLQWRDRRAGVEQIAAARESGFVSYGSCSFDEPVADLQSLGLI